MFQQDRKLRSNFSLKKLCVQWLEVVCPALRTSAESEKVETFQGIESLKHRFGD